MESKYIYIYAYIRGHLRDSQHTKCSNHTEVKWHIIYVIMKTICSPAYHHNGFVVTDFVITGALGHMMYGYIMCLSA